MNRIVNLVMMVLNLFFMRDLVRQVHAGAEHEGPGLQGEALQGQAHQQQDTDESSHGDPWDTARLYQQENQRRAAVH